MIEKFTKEELDTILKEIKNLPRDYLKRTLCSDSFHRMYEAFKKQDSFNGIYPHDVSDAVLMIADFTFCNYEQRQNGKYSRAKLVPNECGDSYKKFVNDVVKLIEKNMHEHITE